MNRFLTWIGKEWSRKFSSMLWAVFLLQYIHWLSQQKYNGLFWLEASTWSAHASLWIVAIIETVFHIRRWARYLLGFFIIIIAHMLYLDFTFFWVPLTSFEAFYYVIEMNIVQLHPYIWFGFGAAFVFIVISEWADRKGKILFLIISSIVLFSIIDSFSKSFYFWNQVGWMVVCGLLLMVIQHFSEFREKHPTSWQWIKEYPGKVAVPVAILIMVVVLAATIAPNARPFLKDPYTAWKAMRGEKVVSIGKGFGGGSSLGGPPSRSTESGYSRNDEVIGGGFNFDFTEVMKITTSHRSYWRGEVRSHYTGKGWVQHEQEEHAFTDVIHEETSLWQYEEVNEYGFDTSLLETATVTQTIMMSTDDNPFPVLFGAYVPEQVIAVNNDPAQLSFVRWEPMRQQLFWEGQGEASFPKVYQLQSEIPLVDEEGLRQTTTELPEALASMYLQLPDSVTERVMELADTITAEADNDYDRMKLLEQFLRLEFNYTNTPDTSRAKGDDFVDDFLFEVQEGYCDYYSTAMIVMARSLGVPARWVKGYSTGSFDYDPMMPEFLIEQEFGIEENPLGEGTYSVRNADAHSWVEVYFAGYGWIPFEPTSSFVLPLFYPEGAEEPSLLEPLLPTTEAGAGVEESIIPHAARYGITIFASLVSLFLIVIIWLKREFLMRQIRTVLLRRYDRVVDESHYHIMVEFERFLRYARRRGFVRDDHETMRETIERWSQKGNWLKPNLIQFMNVFEKVKYSSTPLDEEEVALVLRVIRQLRADMK